jgi:hypothetical protein
MKPTIPFNDKSKGDFSDRNFRGGCVLPQTDYNYSVGKSGGRCFGSRRPSFRSISQDYFKNEARHSFVGEAALFVVIVMTAAVPIINSVTMLLHLVRSFGTL